MQTIEATVRPAVTRQRQVVVCIDDDAPVLSAVRRLLRHEPYEVITTLDPVEVLRLVETREVNLIIADQRMPQMLGTELLKTVRQRSPGTICVILTGHADLSDIAGAMNDGAVDRLIRKPWDDSGFRKMIRDLLDRKGAAAFLGEEEQRPPPDRVVVRIPCAGRLEADVLREISETLDGAGGPPPRVVFALQDLMKLQGSLNRLLSDAIRAIAKRGARAALVDGTGAAGAFLDVFGGRVPLVVYRTVEEMGRPKRVLVVEDRNDNIEFLLALIESAGHEIEVARSVPQAIRSLEDRSFDLVLLDLVLPDSEGLELARHILERQLPTPVLAMSGFLDRGLEDREPRRPLTPRPYSAKEILEAIRDS